MNNPMHPTLAQCAHCGLGSPPGATLCLGCGRPLPRPRTALRRFILVAVILSIGLLAVVAGAILVVVRSGALGEEKTATRLERAAKENPRDFDARFELANFYYFRGEYVPAIEWYANAVELKPDHALAHARLGFSYVQMERFAESIPHFEKAVALDPQNFITLNNLGLAYERLQNPEKAVEMLRKALELRPKHGGTLSNYGFTLLKAGRYDEAIAPLQEAARLEPNSPLPHYNLAMIYSAKGNRETAKKELEMVRRLDPNMARQLETEMRSASN